METFVPIMPQTSSKSRKGALCELIACMWLLSEGYEVFRNVAPCGPADLVVFKNNEIIKIDVKSISRSQNNGLIFRRHATRKAIQNGVEVLYVLSDGSCKWAEDCDPLYGKTDVSEKLCLNCGLPFTNKHFRTRFCLTKCRRDYWRKTTTFNANRRVIPNI